MINKKTQEIVSILHGVSKKDVQIILEKVMNELLPKHQPSLAETIVTGILDDEYCGMTGCPFHCWTRISHPQGPVDSVCNLPGDGGNVIECYPNIGPHPKRLPKCLKIKPPQ